MTVTSPAAAAAVTATAVPASGFQTGLWYLSQSHPDAPLYSLPMVLRLRGPVDVDGIRAALRHMVARHEILGLRFASGQDGLRLVPAEVLPEPGAVDLRDRQDPEQAWTRLLQAELARPVDLDAGPGHRALIATLGSQDHAMLLTVHHAYADARSMEILLEDFRSAYETWEETGAVPAPGAACAYGDVARRVHEAPDRSGREAGLAYWRSELAGVEDFAPAADRPRPSVRTLAATEYRRELPPGLLDRIDTGCRQLRASRFMTFASVFAVALARWSGETRDPVLAVPQTLRRSSRLNDVVAPLVNTVPLRLPVDQRGTFGDLVALTRGKTAGAMAHSGIAFDEIVGIAGRTADRSAPPLTSVAFHVAPTVARTFRAGRATVECVDLEPPATDMDLVWNVVITPDGGRLAVQYAEELFDATTVERMVEEYLALAEALVAAADTPMCQVEHRDEAELDRLWAEGETAGAAAETGGVAMLFARATQARPDRTALVEGTRRWTYAELADTAAAVRARLLRAGIRQGDVVALALHRRSDFVAAMLGVTGIGAAYLPLDLEQPAERTAAVITRARPAAVLTDGSETGPAWPPGLPVVALGDPEPRRAPAAPPVDPDTLCYVMCTSGTTGEPKAVRVTHGGVASLAHRPSFVPLGPDDVVLQLAPLYFDASTFEVWGALLNGATLVLPPSGPLTASDIGTLVREHRVTTLHLTAGLLRVLSEGDLGALSGVHTLLTGGDVIPAARVRDLMRRHPGLTVVACYGPTENTTFSTVAVLTEPPTGVIPLGTALPGRSAHVLDEWLRPVAPGAVGELYVGGCGLADGYLGDPRLTAERFPRHPRKPRERLYRTGDMARRTADGVLEFLGRRDSQLKIRGFRVEPAEVEAALLRHPGVARCLVRSRGGPAERTLVAYVVPSHARTTAAALRAHLGRLLPQPLVPTGWVLLEELPLTPRGKADVVHLDRLPLDLPGDDRETGPSTPTESVVHDIWCACLDRPRVGVTTGFFEAGGHSLAALRIAGRLERRFGRPVPLAEVLRRPTIARLAAWIDAGVPKASGPRRSPGERPGAAPSDLALATPDELALLLRLTGGSGLPTEGVER